MTWVCIVASLGSLRCILADGSASFALTLDIAVSRFAVGRALPPLCSLAHAVVAFSMYIWVCPCGAVHFSSNGVQSLTPSSHRGGQVL